MVENEKIQNLLMIYEQASGQQMNRSKTMMTFSNNVKPRERKKIMDYLGITEQLQPEKYLGLPPLVGKDRMKTFSSKKHKVW